MRRALVTMVPMGGGPFTMGDPAITGSAGFANRLIVNKDNPAPSAGTVTSVSLYSQLNVGRGITLCVVSLSGSTLTVRSAVDVTTTAAFTVNTWSGLSLAVQPGDFIAGWDATGFSTSNTSGGSAYEVSTSTKPIVGATYTAPGVSSKTFSINGTGS